MIYYPLCTLLKAGIKEILLITRPEEIHLFKRLLSDGSQWNISIKYAAQEKANGIAEAFIIGEEFIGNSNVCLILGDNIFYGEGIEKLLNEANRYNVGATLFVYRVDDPERYGVIEFDEQGHIKDIVEKPTTPPSSWAVTGLYFYDSQVVEMAKSLTPSPRGELEITDLNRLYLKQKRISLITLGRGMAWLDSGTHESLLDVSDFIRVIEKRQGIKSACPEEVAYENGWLTLSELKALTSQYPDSAYTMYLKKRIHIYEEER
jgi:glucose-1-phosphate thymidylyltransferase